MSIHGICFDNGNSGRCGIECELFMDGECEEVNEEHLLDALDSDEITEDDKLQLIDFYG